MSLQASGTAPGRASATPVRADMGSELLLRKLLLRSPLDADEQAAVRSLPVEMAGFDAKQDLVAERSHVAKACLLIDGIAGRQKLLSDGSRQIVSVYVPGDALELCAQLLPVADCGISALSRCSVAFVPQAALRAVAAAYPKVEAAFVRETLVEAAILREWLLNVGRRDAYSRLAHLFCEIVVRLEAVGLYADDCFELPLTQHEIADATGLTPVHVNRTMQRLRADGLIETRRSTIHVRNWNELALIADFDPTYLYLPKAASELH